jgi:Thiolase, N-terminal domain
MELRPDTLSRAVSSGNKLPYEPRERSDKQEAKMPGEVVIVSAARSPVGSFNRAIPAHGLGAIVIKDAMARASVQRDDVDDVIMGQVLSGGEGQNPARRSGRRRPVAGWNCVLTHSVAPQFRKQAAL